MTADELLPILVYLVITCDIPNWYELLLELVFSSNL